MEGRLEKQICGAVRWRLKNEIEIVRPKNVHLILIRFSYLFAYEVIWERVLIKSSKTKKSKMKKEKQQQIKESKFKTLMDCKCECK